MITIYVKTEGFGGLNSAVFEISDEATTVEALKIFRTAMLVNTYVEPSIQNAFNELAELEEDCEG